MQYLEKTIQYLTFLFLFLLPWQTILLLQERFVNGAKWEYGTLGVFATEVLGWMIVLLFMVWYVARLRTTDYRLRTFSLSKDRLFVLSLLLFSLYSLILSFFVGDTFVAFQHTRRILLGSLLFLFFYSGPVKGKNALWAFILGSIPVSVLGIWQFLSQATVASTVLGLSSYIVHEPGASIIASESIGRWLRAYGSFSHPNVFGGYLALTIFSSLLLYRSSVGWGRVVVHAIIVLQSTALFFTFSRSAFLAVFFGLVVYVISMFPPLFKGSLPAGQAGVREGLSEVRRPPLGIHLGKGERLAKLLLAFSIIFAFCIFSFAFFPLVQTRFTATSQNEVVSITERVAGYEQAVDIFLQHPLFGVGGGNYTYALMQAFPGMPGWWYQPVHSVPLLFVVEVGLVGVALLVFVLVSFVRLQTIDYRQYVLLITGYVPLLLLDHYLWSSYVGLMLIAVFFGLFFQNKNNEV
ncbi:MAG: hypothetical protein COV60_01920 [Candidatus Magasanikbacteria bacterium CG11_big_fil_rev_8_21_14_0_20_43_7]|uniref:O-antigen ligase-related domain-containing protein n=1 Tax=Candidatus Magasanikbacteria bacterium CG11_big_fil_rev_8_21_14_0_20_43_7 TaxID=1974654 RepID=A0A2H0N2N9_9BACT|nr:MAG: hypothetical protein COV60_01920 [Candidatus Magasanikbacteria bacterium CG11_big_fil_rev_8_21_14_0_20_43_7]